MLEGREGVGVEASDADEADVVEAILSATLRIDIDESDGVGRTQTVYRELAVAQILEKGNAPSGELDVLAAHGIRPATEHGVDGIFIHSPTVCQKLLKGTLWGDLNITDILKRVPGARMRNLRLAGRQTKGIWLPLNQGRVESDEQDG